MTSPKTDCEIDWIAAPSVSSVSLNSAFISGSESESVDACDALKPLSTGLMCSISRPKVSRRQFAVVSANVLQHSSFVNAATVSLIAELTCVARGG